MLVMLNQYYNYLVELVLDYFNKNNLRPGDRYSIYLDQQKDINEIVKAFKNNKKYPITRFKHQLNDGEIFEMFGISINEVLFLISYTSDEVTPDFLVKLRNDVSNQNREFKGTALLTIVSKSLESIESATGNLEKKGMPLHPEKLGELLNTEIDQSQLTSTEKLILKDSLKNIEQARRFEYISFFDFASIFNSLQNGKIDDETYKEFSIFKDTELDTYDDTSKKKRLELNKELFGKINRVHELSLGKEELEKFLSSEGVSELFNKGWEKINFAKVLKFHEDYKQTQKEQKVIFKGIQVFNGLTYWEKVENNNTAAGRRKKHIIIFNNNNYKSVKLRVSFSLEGKDRSLMEKYHKVTGDSNLFEVNVRQTNIDINIDASGDTAPKAKVFYKHRNKISLSSELYITVVPFHEGVLEQFKTRYLVHQNKGIELQMDEDQPAILNESLMKKNVIITEPNMELTLVPDESLSIEVHPDSLNDRNEVPTTILYGNQKILFTLKNEVYSQGSPPIEIRRINKLIRESGFSMEWSTKNDRLHHGNDEYNIHKKTKNYLELEKEWIIQGFLSANLINKETLEGEHIDVGDRLLDAYNSYLDYYKNRTVPSLTYIDKELERLSITYIDEYCEEISRFEETKPAGKKGIDLFKLGTLRSQEGIYLTPFHPLLVAFKLVYYKTLGNEKLPYHILDRLRADALIPYLYDHNDQRYRTNHIEDIYYWLLLRKIEDSQKNVVTKSYHANLVRDKINQFTKHFSYLFHEETNAPLLINIINVENEKEILKGVIEWLIEKIKEKGLNLNSTVELSVYNSNTDNSAVIRFSKIKSVEEFKNEYNISLKIEDYDEVDILNYILNSLVIYKKGSIDRINYAHISFYNMYVTKEYAHRSILDQPTGISINGLSSSVPSTKTDISYITGFGLREISKFNENILLKLAYYVNELSTNIKNNANDNYSKGLTMYSSVSHADMSQLKQIYKASHWVTFIDPHFDLDFFNDYPELIVIHYSDQHTSSSSYDAITVTNKADQYYEVIKNFLEKRNIKADIDKIHSTIKAFNTFNGEWLLRIIGSKGHYEREKLSIISAVKYTLSYFNHPDILWVPISMEEVLRVGGVLGLTKTGGIFTSKNLNATGSQSDDLLLIGLDTSTNHLEVHFYPVEVKIGKISTQTINKGIEQVKNIKSVIMNHLSNENKNTFQGRFYRNFFAQLFLINAKKIERNEVWQDKNYSISDEIVEMLLSDHYIVSKRLEQYIGEGSVITFNQEAFYRGTEINNNVLLINFTEEDGYNGIHKTSQEINEWLHESENDFIKENMIMYNYFNSSTVLDEKAGNIQHINNSNITNYTKRYNRENAYLETSATLTNTSDLVQRKEESQSGVEKLRFKIGTIKGSEREIFWEYGHKELPNRHLLITGKSGQGKTYFMQCLLLEKAKQGLSSIVIDYTDGFLPDQLEPEFKEYLGNKLIQNIVVNNKLPLNPFQRNVQNIGGIEVKETNIAIAERVKAIFQSVYSRLGIQQLNAIYEAVKIGLDKYNDDMNLNHLKELLKNSDSANARTALSQIRPLIDRDPFNYGDNFDWGSILKDDGKVYIIQLLSLPRDVQLVLTEFILWDLWNYSVQNGTKNEPIPVVMDESQNLDHSGGSPSERILTEGRKHGWSAWYATQFLRSQLSGEELSRLQMASLKIYFAPPEEEIKSISSTFTNDREERKYWETKLLNLKKGQCIVHGQILKDDGTLSAPGLFIVDISPLHERLS